MVRDCACYACCAGTGDPLGFFGVEAIVLMVGGLAWDWLIGMLLPGIVGIAATSLPLVLSLRSFSRIDEAEFKAVDIHEEIGSTLPILQHRLKAKSDYPEIQLIKCFSSPGKGAEFSIQIPIRQQSAA